MFWEIQWIMTILIRRVNQNRHKIINYLLIFQSTQEKLDNYFYYKGQLKMNKGSRYIFSFYIPSIYNFITNIVKNKYNLIFNIN